MAVLENGNDTAGLANVDANFNLKVNTPTTVEDSGFVSMASENDDGSGIGTRYLLSPETDADYRLRVQTDTFLEDETFNYTAQNTGKHQYHNTTMTNVWGTGGLVTNGTSITTTTTGTRLRTYANFPFFSSGITQYIQFESSFSNQPVANTIIDTGIFLDSATNPYTPTDGVYFRLTSAGLFGVINHNGSEISTAVLSFSYTNNKVYGFLIEVSNSKVNFWINNVLYGTIETPVAQAQPFMAAALPFAMRHVITGGAAGGVIQYTLRGYGISYGGGGIRKTIGELKNGIYGSYQGLSGGTMGTLANFANSANPTAVVPTNTTAALGTGLGGQFWETDTLAVTTDGVICSYQVPAGTVSVQGKRLKVNGVKIESFVQSALTGGGYNAVWSLAFGHTAVSLATAEAATAKAPRRIALGTQSVASAAAALTQLQTINYSFQNPIYVNPAEFIAVVKKKVGTAPSAGVIAHYITFDYAWE